MDAKQGKERICKMATSSRAASRKRNSQRRLRYFYLGDSLYRVMHINRPHDLVECWCYTDRKMLTFTWSVIRKSHEGAWSTTEVGEMLNRTRMQMERYIKSEAFPLPQMTHTLDGQFRPFKYMWSEKDILRLHDYMLTIHRGRPRKDGGITPTSMPSRVELRAMLKKNAVDYYVMDKNGNMVRAWKEQEW